MNSTEASTTNVSRIDVFQILYWILSIQKKTYLFV